MSKANKGDREDAKRRGQAQGPPRPPMESVLLIPAKGHRHMIKRPWDDKPASL
jgi:hypothetical protein